MTTPTAGPRARGSGSPWSPGSPEGPGRFARRTVASFATYAEAERAVDRLADLDFPVERVAVLGQDLQTVEQVTGKLDYWGAAWRGALSGAVPGVLIGWLFGLFSWADPLVSSVLLALYGLLIGALIGAIMGLIVHAMTGGRRDFTSVMAVLPQRYELVVDDEVADRAVQLLGSAT
ncbi:MAG TPA: general stress protein [Blastococcus sp.]